MCTCSFNSTTEKGVTIVQGLKREYGQTKILKDLKKGIRLYFQDPKLGQVLRFKVINVKMF
uniref:Uncharacterized protein n=1 Tax=Oryza glumipatula TaxID=40148 RepID=A0A0E0AUN8_9ORYZ